MSLVRVGKLTNSNRNTRSIDAVYETKLRGTVVRFGKGMRWGVIVHILHSGCTLGMKFRGGNWGGEGGGRGVCMVCEWMSNTVALRSIPRSGPTLLSRRQCRDCLCTRSKPQALISERLEAKTDILNTPGRI